MSLEAKIENLTKAVETLTEQLAKSQDVQIDVSEQTVPAEVQKIEQAEGPSVEDLQALAMKKVREDRTKKAAIKELIGSYDGAKVIGEVPKGKLSELAKKLEVI